MNQEDPGGGLRVPDTTGPGYQEQLGIHQRYNTFDDVETQLAGDGFHPESQPIIARPRLTAEALTHPDDRRYTEMFAAVEAWHTYTNNYYRRIQAKILSVSKEREELARNIRDQAVKGITKKADLPKAGALKDVVAAHPRVMELDEEELKLAQAELLMKSHVDSIDRDLKTCSRLIEIRKMDRGQGRRGAPSTGYGT